MANPKVLSVLCLRSHDRGNGQSLYYTSKGRKTGCVDCMAEEYKKDPEKRKKSSQDARDRDPDKYKNLARQWHQTNSEYLAHKRKNRTPEQKEQKKEAFKKWSRTPEGQLSLAKSALKRYEKLAAIAHASQEDKEDLLSKHEHKCAGCGGFFDKECHKKMLCWDHNIPLSKGGEGTKENLIPLCKSCNSSKRQRTLEEFKVWKGLVEVTNITKFRQQ